MRRKKYETYAAHCRELSRRLLMLTSSVASRVLSYSLTRLAESVETTQVEPLVSPAEERFSQLILKSATASYEELVVAVLIDKAGEYFEAVRSQLFTLNGRPRAMLESGSGK